VRTLVAALLIASSAPTHSSAAAIVSCTLSAGVVDNGWVVVGTPGDDSIDCSTAGTGHFLIGLGGNDLIVGSEVASDVINPGDGVDTVRGGSGPGDRVSFIAVPGPVIASTSGSSNDGYGRDETGRYSGIEDLSGSMFDDSLTGDDGPNILRGAGGDDLLAGGGDPDIIVGDEGQDLASFTGARQGVIADLSLAAAMSDASDVLVLLEGIEGSPFDDVLIGSNHADRLIGGAGTDMVQGGGGADELLGGRGPDTLVGGTGADSLRGGPGTDSCESGPGAGAKIGCEAQAYAEVAGVVLFQPSWDLIGVGYHESLFSSALPLRPVGPLRVNGNPRKFTPPPPADGLPYVVMGSRGRPTDATTSADIVVGSRTRVLSPVNGRVTMVRRYLLYCQAGDWQVIIAPDSRPDLLVMILHTTDIRVQPGDRVVAAVTQIGSSWGNDLPSAEENLYFPDQYPHVHIEVDEGPSVPVPGCL
jgi:hypothetical protein